MNAEAAQALMAGWLSGATAGLAVTALVLVTASRTPALATRLPFQGRLGILGIVAANVMVFGLSLIGLLLGTAYHETSAEAGGGRFPLAVAAVIVGLVALYGFVRGFRRGEAPVVLGGLALSALAFAVMLPWLAGIEA
ncbi:MAG: hypothetical protein WD800_06675 [Dehalococcoidia bacterium]